MYSLVGVDRENTSLRKFADVLFNKKLTQNEINLKEITQSWNL